MTQVAVDAYLADKNADGARLFRAFRKKALAAGPDVEEKVSRTMVAWKGKRAFAAAYVKGRYLEASIDLMHPVEHTHLKSAFHTTKAVITHRFTLEKGERVDAKLAGWLKEAFRTVGPGAHGKR